MDVIRPLMDWLYPRHCVLCGATGAAICQRCDQELPRLGPACPRCALPLPAPAPLCGRCLQHPPPYHQAHAALRYEDAAGELVLAFKNGGNRVAGRLLGEYLTAICGQLPPPDRLIPVPLHHKRLARRGFNQAGVLASQVGAALGISVDHHSLQRLRDTHTQQGLDAKTRHRNLRNAFICRTPLSGHIAIVDDVITTGATVSAATQALIAAGASRVSIWCAARTAHNAKR